MSRVPELRFPVFSGEWEEVKIGQRLKIGSGKDYKHLEEGDIPVYGTGGYMTSVSEYLYDGESVCIGRKGTIDKPMYLSGKFWTVDTLFFTYAFSSLSPKFLYLIFQRINWQKYNEASGVPSLSKKTIEKIKVSLPPLPEQQKIADFLTAIDEKITLTTDKISQLETYKRGMMQKLLSGELRFPGFSGEWKEVKLGEIGKVSMCKRILKHETSPNHTIPFYKIGTFGKEADTYISEELFESYKDKYPYPKTGDILISAAGTIGRTVVFDGSPAYFQDSNIVWIDNDETIISNRFLRFFYQTVRWLTEDTTIARLYNNNLRNIKVLAPSLPEQQKIADFLTSLDDKLTLEKEKLDQLKRYKQGLLQRMFV